MDNNFVEDIMSEIDSELSSPVKPLQKKRQEDNVKETAVKQQGTDSDRRRKAATMPKRKQRQVIAESPRVFAKARIQKSIRFRPDLIARLDDYIYQCEAEGKEHVSIQQIQNEALLQWLESKKA